MHDSVVPNDILLNLRRLSMTEDQLLFICIMKQFCKTSALKKNINEHINLLNTSCEHDYGTRIAFPTHSPEVISSWGQRTLGHYKLPWRVVTLKKKIHSYNSYTVWDTPWILLIHHILPSISLLLSWPLK